MGIFDKRTAFKPFEYPEVIQFQEAIQESYWVHKEYNYISDVQDFHVKLSTSEQNVLKNALLAISQIEVEVKSFWGDLYKHFPKPEFNVVGATFAECEARHSLAYSHLLEILGFNDEFENALKEESILGRVNYLSKYLKNAKSDDPRKYTTTLALFSLFIENVSLFSQFLIVKSFNRFKNVFNGIDNVIQATEKEENIHALFGAHLVRLVQKEHPDWFDDEFNFKITMACTKAYEAEVRIIDWIYEEGELSFLPKYVVVEFIKDRFNKSLEMIGLSPIFDTDKEILKKTEWFNVSLLSQTHTDFFVKTPAAYNKKSMAITEEDLF